jgi:hypothetical protein
LAIAHERACEAELAGLLEADLAAKRCPDIAALRSRFSPDPEQLPHVDVKLGRLASYDSLIGWGKSA